MAREAVARLETIAGDLTTMAAGNADGVLLYRRLRALEKRVERLAGEAAVAMGRETRARMAEMIVTEVASVIEELEGRVKAVVDTALKRAVVRKDPAVAVAEAVGRWIERSPYNSQGQGLPSPPGAASRTSWRPTGMPGDAPALEERWGAESSRLLDGGEWGAGDAGEERAMIGPSPLYDGPDFYALLSGSAGPAHGETGDGGGDESDGCDERDAEARGRPAPTSQRSPSLVIRVPSPSASPPRVASRSPSPSKPKLKPARLSGLAPREAAGKKPKRRGAASGTPSPSASPPQQPHLQLRPSQSPPALARSAPRRLPSLQPETPPLAELPLPSAPTCMEMRPGLARASLACGSGLGVHFVRVLRDPPSLSMSCTVPTSGGCLAVAYSHDGALACALSVTGEITLIDADLEGPVPGAAFPTQRGARALCMDATGSRIAVASGRSVLVLTTAGTMQAVCAYETTSPLLNLYAVAFCPAHPDALASAGDDGVVTVWQLPSSGHHTKPVPIDRLEGAAGHRGRVTLLRFSPDGLVIHSVGQDRRLISRLWQEDVILASREAIHAEACASLSLLPDGSPATGGWDAQLRLWAEKPEGLAPDRSIRNTHKGVTVGIAPLSMALVATCGSDRTIRLWKW